MRVIVVIMMALLLATGLAEGREIVITSTKLVEPAKALKDFHEKMGIESEIVTVEEIWEKFQPAEDPQVSGSTTYANYNYTLAKKIVSFLRTVDAEYVTLLGDAEIIPPSYYVKLIYDASPTDFFYASPDYDLIPNFAVGRLPVSSEGEAMKVVERIKSWYNDLGSGNYRNAAVMGTRIYASPSNFMGYRIDDYEVWQGEAAVKYLQDLGLTATFSTKIAMQSDMEWTSIKGLFDEALSGGYGIVFHVGHGTAYSLDSDDGGMYTTRYVKMLDKKKPLLPIVLTSGCSAAAFDEEIRSIYIPSWAPGVLSEFLLLNDAGATAFVGFTGTTGSNYEFSVAGGKVNIVKVELADNILSKIVKYLPGNRLGDAFKRALEEVRVEDNIKLPPSNKNDEWRLRVYLIAELIGDPTLYYPEVEWKPASEEPEVVVEVNQWKNNLPSFEGSVTFSFGKEVDAKVFYMESRYLPDKGYSIFGELVAKEKAVRGVTFNPPYEGKFLLRISDGKRESWYAFYAKPVERLQISYPQLVEAYVGERIAVKIKANKPSSCEVLQPEGAICENMTIIWTPEKAGNYTVSFVVSSGNETISGELVVIVNGVRIELVSPSNGGLVSLSPKLCVSLSQACTVEFWSDSFIGVAEGKDACITWQGLEEGREYSWYVVAKCNGSSFVSETWKFRTSQRPIADFTYEISNTVKLKSTSYDPDGQKVYCSWDINGSKAEGCEVSVSLKPGSYTVTLTVTDETGLQNETSKVLEVTRSEVTLPLGSKDLDGDGLYEDINGDGVLDYSGDIVYFQWNYKKPEFQDYVQYYDFCRDGVIDIKDVLYLYVYWKWGVKRW